MNSVLLALLLTSGAMAPESQSGPSLPRSRTIAVTLRAPGGPIWSGDLRVTDRVGSTWQQTMSTPVDEQCSDESYGGERNETFIQLSPVSRRGEADKQIVSVTIRMTRPTDDPCTGSRTIEVRQSVVLQRARPAILRLDGGLVAELRPR